MHMQPALLENAAVLLLNAIPSDVSAINIGEAFSAARRVRMNGQASVMQFTVKSGYKKSGFIASYPVCS